MTVADAIFFVVSFKMALFKPTLKVKLFFRDDHKFKPFFRRPTHSQTRTQTKISKGEMRKLFCLSENAGFAFGFTI